MSHPAGHVEVLEDLLRREDAPARDEQDTDVARPPLGARLKRASFIFFWVALFLGLPALFLIDLVRQPAPPPVVFSDDDLHTFAVRAEDLPPGFVLNHESRSANEDLARYFADPERAGALLDGWARQGGVGTLLTNDGPPQLRQTLQVATAVERYPDAAHARLRYQGRGDLFRGWNANPSATTRVRARRVGDQSAVSRMYVTDETGQELVVYSVTFRTGPIVADITTTGYKFKDDRGRQAYQLARLVDERISAHLQRATSAAEEDRHLGHAGRLVRWVKDASKTLRRGLHTTTLGEINAQLEETRERFRLVTSVFPEP